MLITEFVLNHLGITDDNLFESTIQRVLKEVSSRISAIGNFSTFKQMMFARNAQLNLQALRQMEAEKGAGGHQKTQITSGSDDQHSSLRYQSVPDEEADEDEEIKKAIEESKKIAQVKELEEVEEEIKELEVEEVKK